MIDDLKDVKAALAHVAKVEGDLLCRAALRDIEALEDKVRSLTALLDNQLGTPCEQVRHQEQIEALEAERDALKRELNNMRDLMRGTAKNMLKAMEGDQ